MTNEIIFPQSIIVSKIFLIRGRKVMLDRDLAELYGVSTKVLNQSVKRSIERFPSDFMFLLSQSELSDLRSQIVTSSWGGTRRLPYAFTEQGVAMLSGVIKSKQAVRVNIQIIRTFIRIRQMLNTNRKLKLKIEEMERGYDKKFRIVFDTLKRMIVEKEKPRKLIGFSVDR